MRWAQTVETGKTGKPPSRISLVWCRRVGDGTKRMTRDGVSQVPMSQLQIPGQVRPSFSVLGESYFCY